MRHIENVSFRVHDYYHCDRIAIEAEYHFDRALKVYDHRRTRRDKRINSFYLCRSFFNTLCVKIRKY